MTRTRTLTSLTAVCLAVILSACGLGSGDDSSSPSPSTPPGPATPLDPQPSPTQRPEAKESQPYPTGPIDELSTEVVPAIIEAAACFYDYQPAEQSGPHEAYAACHQLASDELIAEIEASDMIEPATPYELDWQQLADQQLAAEAVTVTTSTSGHYGDEHAEDTEAYRHADVRLDMRRPDGSSRSLEFGIFVMLGRDEPAQPWKLTAFDYTPSGSGRG